LNRGEHLPFAVSENGPREGTKDLPRRDPDAGQRSIDPTSPGGRAYERNLREERRRREELRELARRGLSSPEIRDRYRRDHPFERAVSDDELAEISDGAAKLTSRRSRGRAD
jgi:hypothetical protein